MRFNIQDIGGEWLRKLPNDWKVDRIKDVCDNVVGGGTPKSSVSEFWEDGEIIWVSPTDFGNQKGNKYVSDSEKKITELGLAKSSATLLPKGTVVMSSRASIGEPKIAGKTITTNQGFVSFIPSYKIDNDYLFYCIEGYLGEYFKQIASGTTFMEISRRAVKMEKIPLPPIEVQKSISNHLDESLDRIDRIIQLKQIQIKKIDEYYQSVIVESLTKGLKNVETVETPLESIKTIPKTWKLRRIKDVCNIVGRIGFRGYRTSDLVDEGEGAITLSPSNIVDYRLKYDNCTFLSWHKYEESPEIKVYDGDVIFVKTGSSFGKVGLVENLPEKATINPQLVVFKELRIKNKFLFYCIASSLVKSQINASILGGTIPTLSQSKLGRCYLPVPPLEEQIEIVQYLQKIEDKVKELKAITKNQIEVLSMYRKSMIHECITGKKQFDK